MKWTHCLQAYLFTKPVIFCLTLLSAQIFLLRYLFDVVEIRLCISQTKIVLIFQVYLVNKLNLQQWVMRQDHACQVCTFPRLSG